jgi:hypothetical protein
MALGNIGTLLAAAERRSEDSYPLKAFIPTWMFWGQDDPSIALFESANEYFTATKMALDQGSAYVKDLETKVRNWELRSMGLSPEMLENPKSIYGKIRKALTESTEQEQAE